MSTLFLCGAGNPSGIRLAININKVNRKWEHIVILDDDHKRHGSQILNCPVVGGFDELQFANPSEDAIANLVASSTQSRYFIKQKLQGFAIPFTPLIHPAVDTLGVDILDKDVTVYENATLGANSSLYSGTIVFMNAVLGHGATMFAGSIVGPGAVINARVKLGEYAYFGTNASILPDLHVGNHATVGANSSIMENIPAGATFIGVPAININQQEPEINWGGGIQQARQKHLDENSYLNILGDVAKRILNTDKIDANANFFSLGGSSRQALEFVAQLKTESGISLHLLDIFRYPTLSALAKHLALSNSAHGIEASCESQKKNDKYQHAKNRARSRVLVRTQSRKAKARHSLEP